MMKKLLLATAASGLMLSTALAQTSSPPSGSPPAKSPPAAEKQETKPPAAVQKQDTKPPAAAQKQDMGKQDASKQDASKQAGASQQAVTAQKPDQFLASKFSGTDVVGADNKKVGDVSDILFDKDGKILAYVVSIGGFLGIGSKSVAMAPDAFQVVKGSNGNEDKLKISMSQEQLKQMASFEPYKPPRATTTGTGGTSRPTGGGTTR